jgi:Arm DNA-binding domain
MMCVARSAATQPSYTRGIMGKLSDVQIRNWIKTGQSVAKADGGGLTFTLSAKRTAAWVLRYRFGGKARELTIGRYPEITLAKARELATEARARIQQGADVAREKQRANIERAAAKSFRQLATDYMDRAFPALAANTIKQRRHHVEDIIIPKLGSLAARDVTTADVVALIEVVGARSQSVAELVFDRRFGNFQARSSATYGDSEPLRRDFRFRDLRPSGT